MARRTKSRKIAEWISTTIELDATPKAIHVAVAQAAMTLYALGPDEAAELADGHADFVLAELRDIHSTTTNAGGFVRFGFNTSSESFVQGSSFVQPNEEGLPRADAKRKRLDFDSYAGFLRLTTTLGFATVPWPCGSVAAGSRSG